MPYDTVTRESIAEMVHAFYATLLQDETVAPYFTRALGEDLNGGKWHEHLQTLNNFWVLMMMGKKGYMGDPFPPHAFIGELYTETFDRWLEVFKATLKEFYVEEIANKFYKKAEIIGQQFIENLDIESEDA